MKHYLLLMGILVTTLTSFAQIKFFGGVNGSQYASNLYNKQDQAADERLDYKAVPSSSYGVEFGMQSKSGAGITVGFEKSGVGQKYIGKYDNGNAYVMNAETRLNYIKIPIGVQLSSDPTSKASLLINGGLYFAALAGYWDQVSVYYSENKENSYSIKMNDLNYTTYDSKGDIVNRATLSQKPYAKTLTGVHVALGIGFRIIKNLQVGLQLKTEFSLSDIENKQIINLQESNQELELFKNSYSKYTKENNMSRGETRMINLGLQVKARYYLNW